MLKTLVSHLTSYLMTDLIMKSIMNSVNGWQNEDQLTRNISVSRSLFVLGYSFLVLSLTLFGCNGSGSNTSVSNTDSKTNGSSSNQKVIKIVRSKQLTALAVLEKQGTLEKKLQPLGYKVEWPEFAAGPQQLEALNAGGLDIAATAESPPVFSQAADVPLVYLAANSSDGQAISLLVPTKSPVKTLKDLKGKKNCFSKSLYRALFNCEGCG